MREKKLAFYQTEVRRVFCPSPRPTSWRLAQTEIERRIVAQGETRLALRRSGLPAVDPQNELFRAPQMAEEPRTLLS